MNVFMLRNNETGEFFTDGKMKTRHHKGYIKFNNRGRVWTSRSGPIQIIRSYNLKGQVSIVEFELKEINNDPR